LQSLSTENILNFSYGFVHVEGIMYYVFTLQLVLAGWSMPLMHYQVSDIWTMHNGALSQMTNEDIWSDTTRDITRKNSAVLDLEMGFH